MSQIRGDFVPVNGELKVSLFDIFKSVPGPLRYRKVFTVRKKDLLILDVERAPTHYIICHLLNFPAASFLGVNLENDSINNQPFIVFSMREEKEWCVFEALYKSEI
jgi:hypothetical protein